MASGWKARWVGAALVLLALLGLGFRLGPSLADPLDLDVAGFNGAIWGAGSRAAVDDPVSSRLGARAAERGGEGIYVDHPPGLLWSTAVSEAVLGDRPVALRLPVAVATAVVVVATYLLLEALGMSPLAAGLGVLIGLWTSMVVAFGTMVDTWIIGLAPAALLLAAHASPRRRHRVAVLGVLAGATALTSWQGWILAGLVALVDLVGEGRRGRRADVIALVGGVAVAFVIVLAWIAWSDGPSNILTAFGARSGATTTTSFARWPGSQLERLVRYDGIPALLVGGAGLVVALRRPSLRRAVVPPLVTVPIWALVFWQGAVVHPYWLYWSAFVLALGAGVAVDAVTVWWKEEPQRVFAVAAVAVVLAAQGLRIDPPNGPPRRVTSAAAHDLAGSRWSRAGSHTYVLDPVSLGEPAVVAYVSRRPVVLLSTADLADAARTAPDADAVVHVDGSGARCLTTGGGDRLAVLRLGAVPSMAVEQPGSCAAGRARAEADAER